MPKITELPAADDASGAELLSAVQGGVTKRMSVDQIAARVIALLGGTVTPPIGNQMTFSDGTVATFSDGTQITFSS